MTAAETKIQLSASNGLMKRHGRKLLSTALALVFTGACAAQSPCCTPPGPGCCARQSDPDVKQILRSAVDTELQAARSDHSAWIYLDHDRTPGKDGVYKVIETPQGTLKRMTEIDGRPVDPQEQSKETERIRSFVHDPDAQAKERRAGAHDDAQARQMLEMLPNAYIWTKRNEDAETVTLDFRPNPDFSPPNTEARVMGLMAGEMIISKGDNRIRTLRGKLTDDVKFGFGVFGKLRRGGTFDVERREVAPHNWQITETHVHIDGRALLFKTIGEQEDEVKTQFKPSTASTLSEAAAALGVR